MSRLSTRRRVSSPQRPDERRRPPDHALCPVPLSRQPRGPQLHRPRRPFSWRACPRPCSRLSCPHLARMWWARPGNRDDDSGTLSALVGQIRGILVAGVEVTPPARQRPRRAGRPSRRRGRAGRWWGVVENGRAGSPKCPLLRAAHPQLMGLAQPAVPSPQPLNAPRYELRRRLDALRAEYSRWRLLYCAHVSRQPAESAGVAFHDRLRTRPA